MSITPQDVAQLFTAMPEHLIPEKAEGIDAVIQFDLSGDAGGTYWVRIANAQCETGQGVVENPKMTVRASAEDYLNVANGDLDAVQAFVQGKIKVTGDMSLALKLPTLFAT